MKAYEYQIKTAVRQGITLVVLKTGMEEIV